ncbi:unnamed protein product [Ectocarpus sp. 8 AP-2014]
MAPMRLRPLVGRRGAAMLCLPTLAMTLAVTKGSVFDTPAEDLEEEDYIDYGQEVGVATAGLGIGLSMFFGLLTFLGMLAMCCRCKRLHRADLAIAEAEGDNDAGKGLDDMYEIEDYEDNISKHRKILWLFSFIIFLGYLFCAGYAYNGAETTDSSFGSIFDGTDVLLTRAQDALCAENGSADCADGSVGDFMLEISVALIDRLEGVVDFISSLSAVTAPLLVVSANLGTATGVVDTTERAVININNSITSVNAIITGDGPVAELMDGETITNIDDDVLDDVQDGRDALEQATELTESSSLEIAEQLTGNESAITRIKYQLDDVHGNEILGDEDIRNATLTTVLDDVLQPMRDLTVDIYDVQNDDIPEVRENIEVYLDQAVQAVAGIIFLPGVILFLTSLCSGVCQSSKPLYLNMFFVFMTQILFCLVAGVFLAVSKINGDLCDHHMALIEANLPEFNTTVQDVEIIVDFPKVEKILTCSGEAGDTPTDSNNFVDILGIQQIFNISSTLKEASSLITDNSALLAEPKDSVLDAQSELGPLSDFVETDFVGDIDMSELSDEIDDLLEDMPPSPLDWDDKDHQDSVDSFYLNNVSGYSWNNASSGNVTYRGQLENVNWLISLMVPGIIGVEDAFLDIKDPYNFEQARNLTNETVCATDSPFYPANGQERYSNSENIEVYTFDDHWDQLCRNVTAYYETTKKLETLIEENDEARQDLEGIQYEMGNIEGNITGYMGELRDEMNDTLGDLADTLDQLVVDLNGLADSLESLNDVVMGASNYTMCGYIGDFYQDVYLDATCTDLQGNIEAVAGPALTVVILMFLSFCIQGCYGPSMRKRPRGLAGDFDGGKARLNDTADNNLPTPHSPTPLVGNSGF